MRKTGLLWLLCVVAVAFAWGCKSASSTGGEIFGKVVEYGTNKPMPGAEMTAYTEEGEEFTTTTDEQGNYIFTNLPAGSYKVTAYHQGYHLAGTQEAVEVKKGRKEINFQLVVVGGGT